MRFLITPDSYKESLSAVEAAEIIQQAIHNVLPEAECELAPMADGGEGTAECLRLAEQGEAIKCQVLNPLGEVIETDFVWISRQKKAIIEVAKACGLMLIPSEKRNPMLTTTYGVGQLIKQAIDMGCRELVLTLGGTGTNDGGCGMLSALGAEILDQKGEPAALGGRGLSSIREINLEKPIELLKDIKVTVLCDVKSPLLGEKGATYVFGKQKGASKDDLEKLEQGMSNYAAVINRKLGRSIEELPGSGAAGGLGCALYAICEADYVSGSKYVMEALRVEEKIQRCDYVITGEGSIDAQSLEGKVPISIAQIASRYQKPVIVFVGMARGDNHAYYAKGITSIFCILKKLDSMQNILDQAGKNLLFSVENFARVLKSCGK